MSHQAPLLLVSDDADWLENLAATLAEFGYDAHACKGDRGWQDFGQMLGVKWIVVDDAVLASFADNLPNNIRSWMVVGSAAPLSVCESLRAHAKVDVLDKPLVLAELLSKLRMNARFLEFLNAQHVGDGAESLAGWLHPDVWCDCLPHEAIENAFIGCVNIDGYHAIKNWRGTALAEALVSSAAKSMLAIAPEEAIAARSEGKLTLFIPQAGDRNWSLELFTEVRKALALESGKIALGKETFGGKPWVPTASIACFHGAWAPEQSVEIMNLLADGLVRAQRRGGDCIIECGSQSSHEATEGDAATSKSLFADCMARHVMAPCPLVLSEDDPVDVAKYWLRSTTQSIAPVVSEDDRIVAALLRTPGESSFEGNGRDEASYRLDAAPITIDEDIPMSEVLARLQDEAHTYVFVTKASQPLGVITRNSLLALTLPCQSYQMAKPFADCPWNVVADFRPLPDEI